MVNSRDPFTKKLRKKVFVIRCKKTGTPLCSSRSLFSITDVARELFPGCSVTDA